MKKISFIAILTLLLTFTLVACSDEEETIEEASMREASPYYSENVNVCYQIFPIAYADSTGDGYGDLRGISENVEYLSETLNVDCVWLNPFNPSPSYHKYNVTDYYGIDETFGTMEDFDHFMDVMEENEIEVVMDFVINHTDFNHIWFQRSRNNEDDYREWYSWLDHQEYQEWHNRSGWHEQGGEYYYGSFWDQMPELNFQHDPVREEIYNIAEFWINKGISGFRIDAARHIHDSNQFPREFDNEQANIDFFKAFNDAVKSVDEDVFIVGEIWSNNHSYVGKYFEGMDSTFNFSFADSLKGAITNSNHRDVIDDLVQIREDYSEIREDYIDSLFLTNHDMDRIMSEFNQNEDRAKLAARILMTLPGISWIYYGEELGMTGEGPDPARRQPFIWGEENAYNTEGTTTPGNHDAIYAWDEYNEALDGVDEQLDDETSMLNLYIDLIALQQDQVPLHSGALHTASTSVDEIMAYRRTTEEQDYLVIHNLSRLEIEANIEMDELETIYQSHDPSIDGTMFTFDPLSTLIVEIEKGSSVSITE